MIPRRRRREEGGGTVCERTSLSPGKKVEEEKTSKKSGERKVATFFFLFSGRRAENLSIKRHRQKEGVMSYLFFFIVTYLLLRGNGSLLFGKCAKPSKF